jgi:hypothetical protein
MTWEELTSQEKTALKARFAWAGGLRAFLWLRHNHHRRRAGGQGGPRHRAFPSLRRRGCLPRSHRPDIRRDARPQALTRGDHGRGRPRQARAFETRNGQTSGRVAHPNPGRKNTNCCGAVRAPAKPLCSSELSFSARCVVPARVKADFTVPMPGTAVSRWNTPPTHQRAPLTCCTGLPPSPRIRRSRRLFCSSRKVIRSASIAARL